MISSRRQDHSPSRAGIVPLRVRHKQDAHESTILRVTTTGGLEVDLLPDRCLDLGAATFWGHPFAWTLGAPLRHPLDLPRNDWSTRFIGGLIVTCGLDNVGPACVDRGRSFPQHGRIGGEQARNVRWGIRRRAGRAIHWLSGTVAQPDSALRLHRLVLIDDAAPSLRLSDTVVNDGARSEPILVQYHCNLGAPFLAPGGRVVISDATSRPRDEAASAAFDRRAEVDAATDGEEERVFRHEQPERAWGEASLLPPPEGSVVPWAVSVRHRRRTLPWLWQWRLLSSAAYVMGLEPANCAIKPRHEARLHGSLPSLAEGERIVFQVQLDIRQHNADSAPDPDAPSQQHFPRP